MQVCLNNKISPIGYSRINIVHLLTKKKKVFPLAVEKYNKLKIILIIK